MPAAVFLLAMLAVVGVPVYLASRHWRRDIAIAVLVLVTAPSSLLQLKAMLDVYMGITTGESRYAFADMGLGMVTLFNVVWLPAMWLCFRQGRKRRTSIEDPQSL